MSKDPSELTAVRMTRAMNLGIVALVSLVHLGYDAPKLLLHWNSYDSPSTAAGAWVGLAVINVVGAVLLLRGSNRPWLARTLAAATLATGAITITACPPGQAIGDSNWAWNAVGWFGVLVLVRRPLWELATMLSANILITATALLLDGAFTEPLVTQFVAVTYTTVGVHILVVVTARMVRRTARQAMDTANAEIETLTRQQSAEAVFASRQERHAYLREQTEPLLRALADGTADPADEAIQRRCAIEAGRLRRLLAENDDAPNPLLHELLACVDIAERRHVEVDLDSLGETPSVPAAIRRQLTDAPLTVLAAAESRARLTVVANDDEVVVSVVADVPAEIFVPCSDNPALCTVSHREGEDLWVVTRWTAASTSASSTTTPS